MGRVLEKELKPKARWVVGPQDPFIEGDVQKREDQGTDEGEREGLEKFSRPRKGPIICYNLAPR